MSRAQAWARAMEILVCPITRIRLWALLAEFNGEAEPIHLVPTQLQELPEDTTVLYQPPAGLHSRFSVRLHCLSLWLSRDNHKAVVLFAHS